MKERLKKATIDKYLAIIVIIALAFVPFVANLYSTQILGKFITYMIAALALDILWGYGGYIVGISLACQDGLPAFMSSLGKLPAIYAPLKSISVAIILGVLIPALVALVLGYFIFTSKIKGVFYNVITLAFAGLFELFITTNQSYTGGSSGVNGIASGLNKITIGGQPVSIVQWYYIAFISLVVIYILCLWLTESRFGKVIKSVRDNEARLRFLGYNPAVFICHCGSNSRICRYALCTDDIIYLNRKCGCHIFNNDACMACRGRQGKSIRSDDRCIVCKFSAE